MAYDIAANQILAQPVTNYYKGRALRQAEAMADKEGKLLDAQTKQVELENDRLANPQSDPSKTLERAKVGFELQREAEAKVLAGYEAKIEAGESEEAAQAWAQEAFDASRKQLATIGVYDAIGQSLEAYGHTYNPRLDEKLIWNRESAIGAVAKADETLKRFAEKEVKPPDTREIKRGENFVTQEWDGKKYVDIAVAPRSTKEVGDGAPSEKDLFERSDKLRDEYNAQSKEFITVANSYQRIVDSASEPSAAGDLALIFNYMKVLDPGSTVREGEFANASNSGSVPDRIVALHNRVLRGERLSSDQRDDFVKRAEKLYAGQEARHEETVKTRYTELSKKSGVDPSRVVSDFKIKKQQKPSDGPVKVGTPDDALKLPSGTKFITPDGRIKVRP